MEEPPGRRNPAASFTDDIIIEILSRLPVRSVCRFKCVSRSWLNLISDSDPCYRNKLPQTLVSFFYTIHYPVDHHFANITGDGTPSIDPSFPSLSVLGSSSSIGLLDSCDGLLLCYCFMPGPPDSDWFRPLHFAVCNPATENWVVFPDVMLSDGEAAEVVRLCFDRTVSRHFHVIQYVIDQNEDCLTRVLIYSSKTGSWTSVESGWHDDAFYFNPGRSVFLNGFLHEIAYSKVLTVDMEKNSYTTRG
ncbi:hypothetical protein PR202_gb00730 [Eleusine coracana subsp. coracana]|uniref:F-box domain-containing protein n=1 Tax=Eleusine coracana subsp. coracana TaxID=191504 RepID=A0AAV5DUF7_ELECO|nr:hypothetical protein PR202_gb00730 [Eleusine coracana subsp. coracana]